MKIFIKSIELSIYKQYKRLLSTNCLSVNFTRFIYHINGVFLYRFMSIKLADMFLYIVCKRSVFMKHVLFLKCIHKMLLTDCGYRRTFKN